MYRPDRERFEALARAQPIVPVWREVLADTQTPVAAFMRLDPRPHGFLLESVEGGERWARYSFLGGDAFAAVTARAGKVEVEGAVPVAPSESEPPLAYLRRLLDACRGPALPGAPPFTGGAVGYIGYDCVRELERLPSAPPDDLGVPDLAVVLTRSVVVFDHLEQKAYVVTNAPVWAGADGAFEEACARCDDVVEQLSISLGGGLPNPPPVPASFGRPSSGSGVPPRGVTDEDGVAFDPTVDDAEFERWVERAKEHIYAGDIFQVVPSRRFQAELPGTAFGAYRSLRTLNPSPYMYFLRFGRPGGGDIEIVGSSPEPLVRVTGREAVTRPIAGTLGRGRSEEEDDALARELLADEKERAEHVMLVDLARNDLGRVCEFGSVKVDELMVIERYSHVMHIVSNVSGVLTPGNSAFDALTACFPAGTVSGAPKVRAMEIIDSLEATRRGPYAGVVGYFDFSGNLDTCITIRTIVATDGTAHVQAGAGIVADSDPAAEAEETRRKAEALLSAAARSRGLG